MARLREPRLEPAEHVVEDLEESVERALHWTPFEIGSVAMPLNLKYGRRRELALRFGQVVQRTPTPLVEGDRELDWEGHPLDAFQCIGPIMMNGVARQSHAIEEFGPVDNLAPLPIERMTVWTPNRMRQRRFDPLRCAGNRSLMA